MRHDVQCTDLVTFVISVKSWDGYVIPKMTGHVDLSEIPLDHVAMCLFSKLAKSSSEMGWQCVDKDNNSLPHLGEYVIPFKEAIKYVTIDGVADGSVELFSRSAKMGLVKLLRENKTDLPVAGSAPTAWITIALE